MKKIVLSLILIFILVCFFSPTIVRATEINNSNKEKINLEDLGPYVKTVERKIRENWDPPNGKQNVRAVARFKINKDGTINGIKILKPSGNESYDNAAILAISKSSPFRALPINYKRDSMIIDFNFDYHLAR